MLSLPCPLSPAWGQLTRAYHDHLFNELVLSHPGTVPKLLDNWGLGFSAWHKDPPPHGGNDQPWRGSLKSARHHPSIRAVMPHAGTIPCGEEKVIRQREAKPEPSIHN